MSSVVEEPLAAAELSSPDPSILARTARGAGWTVGWRAATRLIGLANTLIVVRLLAPGDFGLVALATAFYQALDGLSYLGVQDLIVRERAPTRVVYDTAATMNAVRGVITAALVAAAAHPTALFFHEPRLGPVLAILALVPLSDGLNNIGVADFRRDFSFDKEFVLLLVPRALGALSSIAFAFVFRNYWALVVGILVNRVLMLVMSYVMHPFRFRPSLEAWRHIAGFSVWTWLISITRLLRDRSVSFILGRVVNVTIVGLFAVSYEIAALPVTELVEPVMRACFSGFAAARHSGGDVGATYRRMTRMAFLVTLPMCMGISLLADPIVRVALGERWMAAVPVMEVLVWTSAFSIFSYLSGALYDAHALLRPIFDFTLASTVIRVALLVPLTQWGGVMGAAIALNISLFSEQLMYLISLHRRFGVSTLPLLAESWRTFAATAIMAAALWAVGLGWTTVVGGPGRIALQVVTASAAGVLVYVGTVLLLWRLAGAPDGAEADFLAMLRRRR